MSILISNKNNHIYSPVLYQNKFNTYNNKNQNQRYYSIEKDLSYKSNDNIKENIK